MTDTVALVPAAGRGVRLGPGAPKALRELRGESLLSHAVRRLAAAPSIGHVVIAAPPGSEADVRALLDGTAGAELTVVAGGAERQHSVASALEAAPEAYDIVLVHDAARALAPADLAERVAAAVRAGHDAVIPVLPVVDTVKQVDADGRVVATVDRTSLRLVQTPQGFHRAVLWEAHRRAGESATDDAGLVERLGLPVHTVPGSEQALKVTRPHDLAVAELLLDEADVLEQPGLLEEPGLLGERMERSS
ncbi:MAG: 2-C-methyl-D-erythritol 4-phosphate cytidylyltransferase [Micromonosporaceae bacterium]|nr:2-C-methyl-D-erythritol 4-phosphate cytidylyltransferase [Micromonosporaceae bacterium]